jgi:hypothetical protein
MSTDPSTQWHTRKWYKEHFGVDPTRLPIQPLEAVNPYYRSAAPMLLWREEDVSLFRSEDGIERYARRRAAGQKAYETAKKKREAAREQEKRQLIEWWKQVITGNPRVQEIVKRLWEIGEDIYNWHDLKAECRNGRRHNDCDERDCSDHYTCKNCEAMSQEQDKLREERERLFEELQSYRFAKPARAPFSSLESSAEKNNRESLKKRTHAR